MASSSSVGTNELSSSAAAKQSSSPNDFEKSRNRLLSSSSLSSSLSLLSDNHSSPDSPLVDPFGDDEETLLQFSAEIDNRNFKNNIAVETTTSPARDDESPMGKLPVAGGSNSDNNVHLALESPPNQVMERNNTTTSATASPNRIPSHVFKRSKSNTPVDWSLTSNESLFSIHMGNMSFTKEQFLLWRLDDLGTPGERSPSGNLIFNNSGPLPPPPPPPGADSKSIDARSNRENGIDEKTEEVVPKQSTIENDADVKQKHAAASATATVTVYSPESLLSHRSVKSTDDGVKAIRGKINYEPAAVGTARKDFSLRENICDVAMEKRFSGAHISRMSAESNNSTKSFAFPILEGADKGTSISISSSPKIGTDPLRTHSQTVNTPKRGKIITDQQQESELIPEGAATTQPKTGSSWFSCFSSCSCCR